MGKKKDTAPTAGKKVDGPPPNWPPFKPLPPPSDLTLHTLLEQQIILIRNFWTKKLCKDYVSFLEKLPLTTTPGKPKKGEALRVNDRFEVMDEGFANRLWLETGLRELICGEDDAAEEDEEVVSKEERQNLWWVAIISINSQARVGDGQCVSQNTGL